MGHPVYTNILLNVLKLMKEYTYYRYRSSDDRSRIGMPDRNSIIKLVKMGDIIATHSKPCITFSDTTKMPHQITISPK